MSSKGPSNEELSENRLGVGKASLSERWSPCRALDPSGPALNPSKHRQPKQSISPARQLPAGRFLSFAHTELRAAQLTAGLGQDVELSKHFPTAPIYIGVGSEVPLSFINRVADGLMKRVLLRSTAPLFSSSSTSSTSSFAHSCRLAAPEFASLSAKPFSISSIFKMSNLQVDLTAPNGRKITLPTGLFINNEFVKATGGQTITSISPT